MKRWASCLCLLIAGSFSGCATRQVAPFDFAFTREAFGQPQPQVELPAQTLVHEDLLLRKRYATGSAIAAAFQNKPGAAKLELLKSNVSLGFPALGIMVSVRYEVTVSLQTKSGTRIITASAEETSPTSHEECMKHAVRRVASDLARQADAMLITSS